MRRAPARFRAVEAPSLAHDRTSDEQRPGRQRFAVRIAVKLDAVRGPWRAHLERAGRVRRAPMDAALINRMLDVRLAQQDTEIRPRMIVQRAILVIAHELVQINVHEAVLRDHEPSLQERLLGRIDVPGFLARAHVVTDNSSGTSAASGINLRIRYSVTKRG